MSFFIFSIIEGKCAYQDTFINLSALRFFLCNVFNDIFLLLDKTVATSLKTAPDFFQRRLWTAFVSFHPNKKCSSTIRLLGSNSSSEKNVPSNPFTAETLCGTTTSFFLFHSKKPTTTLSCDQLSQVVQSFVLSRASQTIIKANLKWIEGFKHWSFILRNLNGDVSIFKRVKCFSIITEFWDNQNGKTFSWIWRTNQFWVIVADSHR